MIGRLALAATGVLLGSSAWTGGATGTVGRKGTVVKVYLRRSGSAWGFASANLEQSYD